ncbi:hemin uptake protein HemP [Maioricimonas sp. JC845]|uniref:hemin uptake protein HemP n=1 Tax=Maioricimonas sp. JC845 TaxID=3232138 RepID=UPI003459D2BF
MTMPADEQPDLSQASDTPVDRAIDLRVVDSRELLRGDREVLIRHSDQIYRLRLTKSGKLILQK